MRWCTAECTAAGGGALSALVLLAEVVDVIRTDLYEVAVIVEGPYAEPLPLAAVYAVDAAEAVALVQADPDGNPDGLPVERLTARIAEYAQVDVPPGFPLVHPRRHR